MPDTAPYEAPCPACALPASEVRDGEGDIFTTCTMCETVWVTPAYAEGPTLSYPTPQAAAEREAVKREIRENAPADDPAAYPGT
jgi:hypothetical protein